MHNPAQSCLTCGGSGEVASEQGPEPCPDCFGAGQNLDPSTKVEWRLRRIEQSCQDWGRDAESAARWLIHEVRMQRESLLRILTRCQDSDAGDAIATDVKYFANEALGFYEPEKG
jgi:hypothetical protein